MVYGRTDGHVRADLRRAVDPALDPQMMARHLRCTGSYLQGIVVDVKAIGEVAAMVVRCCICRRPFRRSTRGLAPQTVPPHKPGWKAA